MRLKVFFVWRRDEDGPEALAIMDEWSYDENPEWWDDEKRRQIAEVGTDTIYVTRDAVVDIPSGAVEALFELPELTGRVDAS